MASRFEVIALLLWAWAATLSGATFEARSQHHALSIDVLSPGNYTVRVTDTATREVLLERVVAPIGLRPTEIFQDIPDGHILVRVGQKNETLVAGVDIERAGMLTDSIQAAWSLAPRRESLLAPRVYRVGGDVKAPVLIRRVEPRYTDEARKARITGIVLLEMLIDKTGAVTQATVLKPLPFGLSESALDAVRQWTFQPATRNGRPVDVVFKVAVSFNLDRPVSPK